MRRTLVILSLLAEVVSGSAYASSRFDLKCVGTKNWFGSHPQEAGREATSFELRIDLAAKKVCYNSCDELYDIERSSAEVIVISIGGNDAAQKSSETIDRRTGRYGFFMRWEDDVHSLNVDAKCSVMPFKGFPD